MFANTVELRILADTVRRASRERIAPLAASIDEKGEFNREVEALFWDLGLMTLTFPPEHGGAERDQGTALCLAVEEIARHCASSALLLIIQAVGSFPILHGGRPGLLEKLLPVWWSTGNWPPIL
jgi:cyclohexane-1-carbonyl-CoA dehydrogenase